MMVERGILLEEALTEFEKKFIRRVLEHSRGNQCRAAKTLGIHRNTLSRKITRISPGSSAPPPLTIANGSLDL